MFNNFNTYRNGAFEDRFYDKLAVRPGERSSALSTPIRFTAGTSRTIMSISLHGSRFSGHLVVQPNAIMLEANKQALYQFMATHDLLGLDMLNGRITVPTLKALELVGVRYLTFHTSDAYFMPPVESDGRRHPRRRRALDRASRHFPHALLGAGEQLQHLRGEGPVLAYRHAVRS